MEKKPVKILFVCLGNICRSPAAQGVMESMIKLRGMEGDIIVDSAGTYGGHAGSMPDKRMQIHAQRRGYELIHESRRITAKDFAEMDLIICMDRSNIITLQGLAANIDEARKIVPIAKYFRQHPNNDHIPDPYYEGAEGFEIVLDLLEDACLNLIEIIGADRR
ncbi:MAG: low molecular weight protein-tyrosine-phosphatase [Muribaculaceae bacterium]